MFQDKLKGTSFAEEVKNITECFDKTTKLRFRNSDEPAYIKFGSMKDQDLALNIRAGHLKLAGYVLSFHSLSFWIYIFK